MKSAIAVLSFVLVVFSSAIHGEEGVKVVAAASADEEQKELEYLELVMNIFRYHVKALELLTDEEIRYSDNVVRHTTAIWHTSGLLDHIYPGDDAKGDREWPWKNEKEFQKRAEANRKAAKQLRTSAAQWLEDQDREKFIRAIEDLKSTCRDCHGKLRDWP